MNICFSDFIIYCYLDSSEFKLFKGFNQLNENFLKIVLMIMIKKDKNIDI